jgi:hypothetical protein
MLSSSISSIIDNEKHNTCAICWQAREAHPQKSEKAFPCWGKRLSGRFVNSDSDYIRERNKGNALALVVLEAVAAVDGTVVSGLERDLGGRPALCADRIEHLAVVAACGLAAGAAIFAADRLVLEPFLRVKLLLAGRKDEFLTAILAYQCFVLEHLDFSPFRFVKFF